MRKIISLVEAIIFNRAVQIAVLSVLFLLPTLFWGQEWCEGAEGFSSALIESGCGYLVENNPVTNALLLALTQMFIMIILASDWNLISGFTGYVDFGHVVFFGLGAFVTALLMGSSRWEDWPALLSDWSFWPAMIVGGIVASLFALFIGSVTLRLKGPYFSIAMLGTLVAMRELVRVARNFSGGGLGLNLPIYLNRPLFYYLTLGLAVGVVLMMSWLRRTEFGQTLIAIREDEVGAEMRGINTTLHKITAFMIATFFTGMVGGIWAYQNSYIDADIAFLQNRTIDMVMTTMLGGLGTVPGPVLGSVVLYWLRDVVWANFLLVHQIFEGILLIIIVLFVPEGIMGIFNRDEHRTSLNWIVRNWFRRPEEESVKLPKS
ncbi:MAG: branched-chain amino acid ABC transporter permease [Anaerolineales bacterium]|nr:branched-chain amino acid ABC transporter permease [Anaerolineales bacterium]